eukprot:TRINITY_DN25934_c0_g1_i1.p1 TRINITY_DN25934_c0_g1~~TRINITY_DN25934_c0_g1_i1.p1  ORF type:complete len:197 (+),score=29.11 TRINITY_DN25934_c0_g1_i1:74-664(+)
MSRLLVTLLASSFALTDCQTCSATDCLRSGASSSALEAKAALVLRLLAAKAASGKTFDDIADEIGLTNAYTANLFHAQAQLKPGTAERLRKAVPGLASDDIELLKKAPMRSFDPSILQDPTVYRFYEAITHYGASIKALINEKFGDGIMSAIDMFLDVGSTVGKKGERRVVVTMNGKFLPHIEQEASENTAPAPRL